VCFQKFQSHGVHVIRCRMVFNNSKRSEHDCKADHDGSPLRSHQNVPSCYVGMSVICGI